MPRGRPRKGKVEGYAPSSSSKGKGKSKKRNNSNASGVVEFVDKHGRAIKRRKRKPLSQEARDHLESLFLSNMYPVGRNSEAAQRRKDLGAQLGIDPKAISRWYDNRRQKKRLHEFRAIALASGSDPKVVTSDALNAAAIMKTITEANDISAVISPAAIRKKKGATRGVNMQMEVEGVLENIECPSATAASTAEEFGIVKQFIAGKMRPIGVAADFQAFCAKVCSLTPKRVSNRRLLGVLVRKFYPKVCKSVRDISMNGQLKVLKLLLTRCEPSPRTLVVWSLISKQACDPETERIIRAADCMLPRAHSLDEVVVMIQVLKDGFPLFWHCSEDYLLPRYNIFAKMLNRDTNHDYVGRRVDTGVKRAKKGQRRGTVLFREYDGSNEEMFTVQFDGGERKTFSSAQLGSILVKKGDDWNWPHLALPRSRADFRIFDDQPDNNNNKESQAAHVVLKPGDVVVNIHDKKRVRYYVRKRVTDTMYALATRRNGRRLMDTDVSELQLLDESEVYQL